MSDIRDSELDIGMTEESAGQRDAIYAEPVRGAGALKGLYAKGNRKRLYVYVGVFFALFVALVYTFMGAENPTDRGGDGVVRGGQVTGRDVDRRSIVDREEAERYNTEQLAREQEENIYAHPVILTDVGEAEDDYSPFAEQTNLKTPTRLSETGNTQANNSQQTQGAQAEYYDEEAYRSADDLARILIEGEAVVPVVQTVSWTYAYPKNNQVEQGGAGGGGVDGGNETSSCVVSLARAGSMAMATVDIALNSDVGGPASITINSGKLRGSRLIGSFERKEEWLRLEFDKMVTPDETIGVSAIALDLDTTLNAVQGQVNRHTLYRYGWWGVGTALSVAGKAAETNQDKVVVMGDNGLVTESSTKDSQRALIMALGELGNEIGDVMRDRINRPITVTLKTGDEVGVFFMDDVCLSSANK